MVPSVSWRIVKGTDLFLKSSRRAIDAKCKLDVEPGQHGVESVPFESDFRQQLRERQKNTRIYGVLERQFVVISQKQSVARVTPATLLQLLECRLITWCIAWDLVPPVLKPVS